MALWYEWNHLLSDAENWRRHARYMRVMARLRWKNPPLGRILHYTRRERARIVKASKPTVKSCGRVVRVRRVIRSYAWA